MRADMITDREKFLFAGQEQQAFTSVLKHEQASKAVAAAKVPDSCEMRERHPVAAGRQDITRRK